MAIESTASAENLSRCCIGTSGVVVIWRVDCILVGSALFSRCYVGIGLSLRPALNDRGWSWLSRLSRCCLKRAFADRETMCSDRDVCRAVVHVAARKRYVLYSDVFCHMYFYYCVELTCALFCICIMYRVKFHMRVICLYISFAILFWLRSPVFVSIVLFRDKILNYFFPLLNIKVKLNSEIFLPVLLLILCCFIVW